MRKQGIWILSTLFCVSQCFSTLSASENSEDRQRDTFTLYDRNRRELDWDRQHGGHRGFGHRDREPDTTSSPHNEQAWIYGSDRRDERNRATNRSSNGYSPYEHDYNWDNGQSWDGRNYYQPPSNHRAVSRPAMPPTE